MKQQAHQDLKGATEAQLRRAAGSQSLLQLQQAIAAGGWTASDIDQPQDNNKSVLHMAAWKGCLENVKYLIEEVGCDVNAYSKGEFSYGKTAIFFAATQSRQDVMEYLLNHVSDVKVTIVNNKGQSVLSIASSHDMSPEILQQIKKLEQRQKQEQQDGNNDDGEVDGDDGSWWNFRATHSDHLEYGDLDPRFLDRPPKSTDVVTPFAINPTNKQSRKGNFARRNPQVIKERQLKSQNQQDQKQTNSKQRAKRPTVQVTLKEEEEQELQQAWDQLLVRRDVVEEDSSDSSSSADALQIIVRLGDQQRKAWIPEAAKKLLECFPDDRPKVETWIQQAILVTMDTDATSTTTTTETKLRHKQLLEKLLFKIQGRTDSKVTTQKQQIPKKERKNKLLAPSLEAEPWKAAGTLVQGLSMRMLEHNKKNTDSASPILQLPFPPIFVNTIDQLIALKQRLTEEECQLVAIDSEWYDRNDYTTAVSTIQIAFLVQVEQIDDADDDEGARIVTYVVDLILCDSQQQQQQQEYRNMAQGWLLWMFHSIPVLGFAVGHDVPMLEAFVERPLRSSLDNLLDLQHVFLTHNKSVPGLKACAARYSDTPLAKEQQCSDWAQRPLTQGQLDYAGLDAAVLLVLLAEYFQERKKGQDE